MSSHKDSMSDDVHESPSFDWLVIQNNEQKNKIRILEMELYNWKINATENKEKLRRLYQNRNKENYVDSFYDLSFKKLIKSLTEQNVSLKNELCVKDVSVMMDLREKIQMLEKDLHVKRCEVDALKRDIESIQRSDNIVEFEKYIHELRSSNMKLNTEHTDIRNRLRSQSELSNYLKSEFSAQRKEFVKLFSDYYLKYGEGFIRQLRSIDGDDTVPEFLSKPIQHDILSSTESTALTSHVPAVEKDNSGESDKRYEDSGIDTLPDEFRQMMTDIPFSDLKEANDTIAHLKEQLIRVTDESNCKISQLEKQLKYKIEEHVGIQNTLCQLHQINERQEKELTSMQRKLNDRQQENSSLTEILRLFESERGEMHQEPSPQSYSSEMQPRDVTKRREIETMKEPHQLVPWNTFGNFQQQQLVRDSVVAKGKGAPTETRDITNYSPRWPPPPAPIPPISPLDPASYPPRTTSMQKSKSTEDFTRTVRCDKCNMEVEIDKFGEHSTCCRKSNRDNYK